MKFPLELIYLMLLLAKLINQGNNPPHSQLYEWKINCKGKFVLEDKSLPGGGCAGGIGGCEVSILGILDGGGGSEKHLEVLN